jgi:hypothetical protein
MKIELGHPTEELKALRQVYLEQQTNVSFKCPMIKN